MMKEIKLNNGSVCIVDDDDYEDLNKYKWKVSKWGYAVRELQRNGKWSTILMHRVVNRTPVGMVTDHINGNKLDNRRFNLRTCTTTENNANRSKEPGKTSI